LVNTACNESDANPNPMHQHKSSRHAANRRYYERNRERILQLRRASRNETRARLQYLENLHYHQLPPIHYLLNPPVMQASGPEENTSVTKN
ncbi:13825_t:CDS:2, partial [Cetraspora pellucida]